MDAHQPLRGATAVIPAAGAVRGGVTSLGTVSSPAMLPLDGKPVIHWLMRRLNELGIDKFRLGVAQHDSQLENFVRFNKPANSQVEWKVLSGKVSVGEAVLDLCHGLEGPALVVFGDTLFSLGDLVPPRDRPWILTGLVEDSSEWCVVTVDEAGNVTDWFDKIPDAPSLNAAIGVYWVPRVEQLGASIRSSRTSLDVSELFRAVGPSGVLALEAHEWLDCGRPRTYDVSRRRIVASRVFNQLEFDELRGTVRKESTDPAKLIDEIQYLTDLPPVLKPYFPRTFGWSTDGARPWIEMEYINYPTVTELFLYHELPLPVWETFLDRMVWILRSFRSEEQTIPQDDVQAMYEQKTEIRIAEGRSFREVEKLVGHEELVINGVECIGLPALWERIREGLNLLSSSAIGAAIHGDLCFSNILHDPRSGIIRFLDPRGSFGRRGHFGDQRYDIAKLHHSMVGKYDHLVSGQFDLKANDRVYDLEIGETSFQRKVVEIYRNTVLNEYPESEIDLITGLIFLGLSPLHVESEPRQVAFMLQGIVLAEKGLDGLGVL